MKIDLKQLKEHVSAGLISERKHPTEELYIYNYTKGCTIEKKWDDTTMAARGLILDKAGHIIARPFKKFFNYSELPTDFKLPNLPYKIFKKLDGSLGISYWVGDKLYIATRGSFESEQSAKANEILQKDYYKKIYNLSHNKTYLFEIISRPSKIVVNYEFEDLILIGIVDYRTGKESSLNSQNVFKVVETVTLSKNFEELQALNIPNEEGYVIRYDNGFRFKLKFEDYIRLHAIITNCSNKAIWESLRAFIDIDKYLKDIPDELYNWVTKTKNEFQNAYNAIYNKHLDFIKSLDLSNKDLKEITSIFSQNSNEYNFHILINLYRGKFRYVNEIIWDILKPKYEKPYFNGQN